MQISRHAGAGDRDSNLGFVRKRNSDGISGRARLLPSRIFHMPLQLPGSAGASPSRFLTKPSYLDYPERHRMPKCSVIIDVSPLHSTLANRRSCATGRVARLTACLHCSGRFLFSSLSAHSGSTLILPFAPATEGSPNLNRNRHTPRGDASKIPTF